MSFLNPTIWTEAGKLKPKVRTALLEITKEVEADLKEKFPEFNFDELILRHVFTGSLTGPDWDEFSDVDLHFIIDFNKIGSQQEHTLMKYVLNSYAKMFNQNGFKVLDFPLELYFQDTMEIHYTPGVYNLDTDEWIQKPTHTEKIAHTKEDLAKARDYAKLIRDYECDLIETSDFDGFIGKIKAIFEKIREERSEGLSSAKGMASSGNVVFKLLRRNGTLQKIVDIMKKAKQKKITKLLKESVLFRSFF